jgi:hypothetical protein
MTRTRAHARNDGRTRSNGRSFAAADSHRIRRAVSFVIVCGLFLASSAKSLPENEGSVEYPVKLAFLYNFTKFVDWPRDSFRSPTAPIIICIVGDDPFSPNSESELRTRTAGGHPIEVRTLRPTDILNVCQVAFVPFTAEEQATSIVRELKGSSTLTVGESVGFAALGGIINFTVEGNKLHFEVNVLAADRAGLKISANMLALARIVHDGERSTGD